MVKFPPWGLFRTPIRLSNATVPPGSLSGTVVGQLLTSASGVALSVISGAFTISAGNLLTSSTAGVAGSTQTVRIRAARANPYLQVDQDFVVTAVAPVAQLTNFVLSASVVLENAVAGVVIGTLSSTLSGATYSMVDDAGGRFAISGSNLVTGATATNYESATSHSVTIRATRGAETLDKAFTVNVSNVTEISGVNLAASTVSESAAPGTVVGALSSVPAGAAFTLIGTAGNRFAISGNNLVTGATSLDYETATSHSVTVRGTIGGETFDQVFTVNVTNVLDAATLVDLTLSPATFNTTDAAGTVIGTIGNKAAGSTLSISPNDGRVVFNGGQTQLLVGLTASSAGTINYTITETLADSPNSPRSTVIGVTATGLVAPSLTTAPSIAGTGAGGTANPTDIEGTILTATPGVYAGSAATLTGQWQRNGVDIAGETALTYKTISSDVGAVIRYRETATNGAGSVGPTASSNTITIKNGYLTAFGFRSSSTATLSRASYLLSGDRAVGSVTRAPASGPAPTAGTYNMGTAGGVNVAADESTATYGANLIGDFSITGSGGRIFTKGLPLNVPLDIRIALGALGFTSVTTGADFYDGDPDAGGTLLFTIPGKLCQGDEVVDASGTVVKGNVWDSNNKPRSVTLTVARTGGLGEIWIAAFTTRVECRFFSVQYSAFNIEKGGVGPYFVNYATGDNTKDGKSAATAWKNFPGDPDAVGGVVKDFILLPGAVVNLEGGQIHKPAAFGSRTTWLFQKAAGLQATPIIVQPRAGTGEVILDGSEDLAFATAVLSGDVYGNPNAPSITTHTGAASTTMIKAPVCAGVPLRPCTWPAPSAITAYDFSDSGSDSYWAEDTVTGPGGSAPLFTVGAADSGGAGFRKVTYTGTRVLSHYGTVSLVGYPIHCRFVGNQIFGKTITSHNTATGQFTFNIDNSPANEELYSPAGVSGFQDFLWQIRYHPFDINQVGQYGYSLVLNKHVGWFPASGQRGLIRFDRFMTAQYGDWQFNGGSDGIQIRGLMGNSVFIVNDASNVSPFPQYAPNRIVFSKVKTRATSDVGRNYLFQQSGGGSGWSFTDIDIADNFMSGGIAILKGFNETISRIKGRESGRTLVYNGGINPNQSTDITWNDLDLSDNSGIHANGATAYQDTQRIKFLGVTAVANVRPFTSQGYTNDFSRANEIGRYIAIGRIQPGYAPRVVSHIVQTNDNNGTNTWWHHGIVAEGQGMLLGPNSAGMLIENVYASKIGETQANYVTGITFKNCLFGNGGVFTSVTDLTNNGATCVNVAFTGAAWDGTITPAIRQALTANGTLGTYSDVTLGATGQTWFVPAVGTTFALQDVKFAGTTSVRVGHQAGRYIGGIINSSPESVLSLPAAVDNALFTLTRGQIAFAATAVAGVYTLRVLQTNNSADRTGPSTKTTDIVITVA